MESLYGIYYYYLELKLKPSGHVWTLSLLRECRKQLKWWRGKDLWQSEKKFSFLATSFTFLIYFCRFCYSLPNFWQVLKTNTYHAASCSSKVYFIIVYNYLAGFPWWYFSLFLIDPKSIHIACNTAFIFTFFLPSSTISAVFNWAPFISSWELPPFLIPIQIITLVWQTDCGFHLSLKQDCILTLSISFSKTFFCKSFTNVFLSSIKWY